jgi:hypothetical protein
VSDGEGSAGDGTCALPASSLCSSVAPSSPPYACSARSANTHPTRPHARRTSFSASAGESASFNAYSACASAAACVGHGRCADARPGSVRWMVGARAPAIPDWDL